MCFCLMNLNRVNLGPSVTFIKYLTKVVFLIFLPKTAIWNKITFPAPNLLNFTERIENMLMKSISKKNLPIFLFLFNLLLLIVKILGTYKQRTR